MPNPSLRDAPSNSPLASPTSSPGHKFTFYVIQYPTLAQWLLPVLPRAVYRLLLVSSPRKLQCRTLGIRYPTSSLRATLLAPLLGSSLGCVKHLSSANRASIDGHAPDAQNRGLHTYYVASFHISSLVSQSGNRSPTIYIAVLIGQTLRLSIIRVAS